MSKGSSWSPAPNGDLGCSSQPSLPDGVNQTQGAKVSVQNFLESLAELSQVSVEAERSQFCVKVGVLTNLASERIISTFDPQGFFSPLHESPALLVKVLVKVPNVTL